MSPAVRVGEDPPGPGAEEEAVVVAWRELRGQAVALAAAAEERAALARRLEAALEARRETLRQGAALDELRRGLELQRVRAEEAVVGRRRALEGMERRKERLQENIERVLPLSRALAATHQRVQEAKEVLSGDKARLEELQRLLRMRQQCMVGQVAALYPVRVFHDLPRHTENLHADTNGEQGTLLEENTAFPRENGTHLLGVIRSSRVRALTLFGWQFVKHKTKCKSYRDKDLQRSAAVLGYVAHAVLLIASYLDVPLRYPLRFGGSRSYVSDCLPSAETASVASVGHPSINNTDSKLTEYPLFLECQEDDSTKASYAIYLLHKDTEQLLNYIGEESSGRHIFGNLRELIRITQSDEYLYR
ncbi:vacuolar protein sorting 38-like [Phragmites australis]|uniref:vacuolar protein sorting 38-like n=1 Tax=Phragmites australis TaxID=29695 RepID=UPI002D78A470|nr:vacuolar protein sorting 38-like [Phragmites australis]